MPSEMPQAERTAIKAYVDSHGTGTHQMFLNGAEAGWQRGRDYGRERERALEDALETIEHSAPGLHAPEPRWRLFAESLQEIARDALAASQPEVLSERSDTEPGEPEGQPEIVAVVSTEQHIDPEVIAEAENAYQAAVVGDEAMGAAISAADEKRGLRVETMEPDPQSTTQFAPQWRYVSDWHSSDGRSQAHPEGQEYAYRVVSRTRNGELSRVIWGSERAANFDLEEQRERWWDPKEVWVERALLGTWEKLD